MRWNSMPATRSSGRVLGMWVHVAPALQPARDPTESRLYVLFNIFLSRPAIFDPTSVSAELSTRWNRMPATRSPGRFSGMWVHVAPARHPASAPTETRRSVLYNTFLRTASGLGP